MAVFSLEEGRRLLEDDEQNVFFDDANDVESNPDEDELQYSDHDTISVQSLNRRYRRRPRLHRG